jgi:UDP:flavonoid glycosyltransferase YjiC (YdhE family)
VEETGFGARLPTYAFEDQALAETIDRLLDDAELAGRLKTGSTRLKENPGNQRAADLIERLAATAQPVTA